MSVDEREVKEFLGDKAWKKVISAASSGRIDGHQMKDLAYALPTDRELDRIGARHVRRMREKDTSADEIEIRNILVDWWTLGDVPTNRGDALEVLIQAFDANIKPLARDLRMIKDEVSEMYIRIIARMVVASKFERS